MMSPTDKNLQQPAEQDTSGNVDVRRRRLLRAGVTSSLLLTITSRPAWAQSGMCTASAVTSANASGGFDFEGCGISAGWWSTSLDRWPIAHATPFHAVFGSVSFKGAILYSGLTLGQVCSLNGGGGSDQNPGNLGMHLVGALLNALTFPAGQATPGFAFTAEQIIAAYNGLDGAPKSSFQALGATLEVANDQYDSNTQKPNW